MAGGAPEQRARTTTVNLSSGGFYCRLAEPRTVGESLRCDIMIPADSGLDQPARLCLRCRASVVRIDTYREAGLPYGVACRIEEYRVAHCEP
jgi:hypothetical protein